MTTDDITEKIIGCAYRVANVLGHGFLEKVYENALTHEIRKFGLAVEQQYSIPVLAILVYRSNELSTTNELLLR